MPKKTSSINWKTVLASIALIGLGGGWMVTAKMTETNAETIRDTQDDIQDIQVYIAEQRTMNTSQYAINQSLLELLKKDQ